MYRIEMKNTARCHLLRILFQHLGYEKLQPKAAGIGRWPR